MRIFADKLEAQLNGHPKQVYLLFGNEPLLIMESRQAIQNKATELGFAERHRFSIDNSFDWNQVYDCCQAMSLFSSRQLIELELPEAGVNVAITKALTELTSMLHEDIMLVIVGGKLTKAQENAQWFKKLHALGDWVSCLSPDIQRLPMFIMQRCRKLGLSADTASLQMLAQWHEGNLFALSQSLEKLRLLYPDGNLTTVRLDKALSRQNHFTVFHWIDALLAGKGKRAQRILRQLEAEGIESVILLRSLQKEYRQLLKMHQELPTKGMSGVFSSYKIWSTKQPLYNAALTRLSSARIQQLITQLAKAEVLVKTQYEQPIWPMIQQLTLETCQPDFQLGL